MTRINRLILSDFRNYHSLDLPIEAQMVALAGDNGAGKTNILEALSLLSPGKGLRRADFDDIGRHGGKGGFAVSVEIEGALAPVQLGAGYVPDNDTSRRCRINREPVTSATAFADHCRILWLTPDNDSLFRGPAGDRRRFLDRLVLAVDSAHGARVNALDKALRSRNRLLEERQPDPNWLDAIEREVAEKAVAVGAARREAVTLLSVLCREQDDPQSAFPFADVALEGDIENALGSATALEVEDWYRQLLRDNRRKDQAAGRTLIGPNTSDFLVRHGPKDMPAALSSTGEQKALLIGLILAHARLVRRMSGIAPIVLLDEVAAHLDPHRRSALYKSLAALGGQVWMTGTDAALFDAMPEGAVILRVCDAKIDRLMKIEKQN
ncbi:MAG: DNA replication/repair protein RecF [Beijerinckiaceae bacterium]